MNKKQTERILLAVVVTILVLYGIYQVAYGTNESSYKFGFASGANNDLWLACTNWNSDCNSDNVVCVGNHNNGQANAVSNVTSCLIGYVEGWKDWCSGHLMPCAKLAMMGAIPGTLDNNQTWDFCAKDADNGWGYSNLIAPCHDSALIKQATLPSATDTTPVQNTTNKNFIGSLVATGPYHHG